MKRHDVILFDLGGVLVELTGVPKMRQWLGSGVADEELWRVWLGSESVRRFETGRIRPREFADGIIKELSLPTSPEEFLKEFTAWPKGVYPGGYELLQTLASTYRLACLSNTNELHWPRTRDEMGLARYFSAQFLSHETGLIKPDKAPFEHVVNELKVSPGSILYVDDNQVCVDAARSVGLDAHRTQGLREVIELLNSLGISTRAPVVRVQTDVGDLLVRPGNENDATAVIGLWQEAAEWLKDKPNPQWTITDYGELLSIYRSRLADGWVMLFTEENEKAAASVAIQRGNQGAWAEKGLDGKALYLRSMVVARRFKGRGLGDDVLAYCGRLAKEQRRPLLRLECQASNKALCDFYLGRGFGIMGMDSSHDVPHYLMEKGL